MIHKTEYRLAKVTMFQSKDSSSDHR